MKKEIKNIKLFDKEYEYIKIEYSSLNDMLDHFEKDQNIRGYASMRNEYNFCQTKNFEDAYNYCKRGWKEGFNNFLALKNSTDFLKPKVYLKENPIIHVSGNVPHIHNYLRNLPYNMYREQEQETENLIKVFFNGAYSAFTGEDQILHNGAIVLSIIEILESLQYDVDFEYSTISEYGNQIVSVNVNLKDINESINYKKVYFPLCHPSFLRRMMFRAEELVPEINADWYTYGCYGIPLDKHKTKELLKLEEKDILYTNPKEMGVNGVSLTLDTMNAFEAINLEKYFSTNKNVEKVKQNIKTMI